MNNKLAMILIGLISVFSLAVSAEEIVECQSDYCVNYFKKFKMGAKRGYVQANATLGQFYYIGYGTDKNEDKALKYLHKAAVKGESSSQYLVGVISLVSEKNRDLKKAIKYLEKVAKKNYKDANYLLGTLYINDKMVAKDLTKADFYLAKAYQQKDKRLPELLQSIDQSLQDNAKNFPKLMAAMEKRPLVKDKNNDLAWPKSHIEIITVRTAPLTTLFDEQLVTFKRRKKTTGSKLQGKTCDEQVGCYQARLGRQAIDTFFNITSAYSYSN
ncbi:Sel1 repeat-containing protein [Colwellia chukchiensis]|uniref:Sel1 repeat-containing protein n=1 Tax=Colwellia chukchiensis TaxID=641665 RepID=A0A1H7QA71_9GAMM|nr:tetratricopeptide repeat protein [Colwellia chukchiensis]SEL44776.1 Sel1 repeat-containing protein [Colwellia chukchiensis]